MPIKFLQTVLFILFLPLICLSLLFKTFIFFQRAQANYQTAGAAYQKPHDCFFLIKHAWGLAYVFAQLPSIWLSQKIKLNLTKATALEQALQESNRGILITTAHLASFEMVPRAALNILEKYPDKKFYAFYKKPHKAYLNPLIQGLRKNLNSERLVNVPANFAGVKTLFQALKAGHVVGVVVDQTPQAKAGIWLDWFGRQAYTSSLVYQLAKKTNSHILMTNMDYQAGAWHMQTQELYIAEDEVETMQRINKTLEKLIMNNPYIYLWGYNRYKDPN